MGKRKAPVPRGYDPGGFRFPGRSTVIEYPTRYADERREQRREPVLVGSGIVANASTLALLAVAAIRRGRG